MAASAAASTSSPGIPFRWRRAVGEQPSPERLLEPVAAGESLKEICGHTAPRFNSTAELAWQTPIELWANVGDLHPSIVSAAIQHDVLQNILASRNDTYFFLFTFPEINNGGAGDAAAGVSNGGAKAAAVSAVAVAGGIGGAAAAPAAVVAGVHAIGFSTSGIVGGSLATSIMSAEAIASGGGVASAVLGGTTATLQSVGATSSIAALGAGGTAAVVCAGAVAGAAVLGLLVWGGFKIAEKVRQQNDKPER